MIVMIRGLDTDSQTIRRSLGEDWVSQILRYMSANWSSRTDPGNVLAAWLTRAAAWESKWRKVPRLGWLHQNFW